MLRAERHARILQIIRENGFIETDKLAHMLEVSNVTIRRDLKTLNNQSLILLDHGGSTSKDFLDGFTEPLYETKVYLNHKQKGAIGAKAASLIENGDTVILDSGTTNAQIARNMHQTTLRNITVITCDLMVAKELCREPNINLIMMGGIMRHSFYSTYGPYTEYVLRNIKANKFFLGIDAASIAHGVSNLVLEEVPIKQLSIQASEMVILVADSCKFTRNAPYRVCGWEDIHRVITDNGLSPDFLQILNNHSIKVEIIPTTEKNTDCQDELTFRNLAN